MTMSFSLFPSRRHVDLSGMHRNLTLKTVFLRTFTHRSCAPIPVFTCAAAQTSGILIHDTHFYHYIKKQCVAFLDFHSE